MKIYLAGGFHGGWQDKVKWFAPQHEYYDPRYDTDQLRNFNIASQDLAGVDWCDLVFVNYEADNPSGVGLGIETGYGIARGKRIIIVDQHDRLHGFLCACGERLYCDIDAAIEYLRELRDEVRE